MNVKYYIEYVINSPESFCKFSGGERGVFCRGGVGEGGGDSPAGNANARDGGGGSQGQRPGCF